jgi:hypothetical protein
MFLAGVEDFLHPIKNIVLVVLDVYYEALLQNNKRHLEFLSM